MTRDWEAAARGGSIAVLQRLLAEGAAIDARDSHGQTGLMLAAMEGHADVVEWLTQHGASLNHTAKYSLSALMVAVIRGHTGVVRQLAAAGADLSLTGSGAPGFAGMTALDLAIERDDKPIVAILKSAAETHHS